MGFIVVVVVGFYFYLAILFFYLFFPFLYWNINKIAFLSDTCPSNKSLVSLLIVSLEDRLSSMNETTNISSRKHSHFKPFNKIRNKLFPLSTLQSFYIYYYFLCSNKFFFIAHLVFKDFLNWFLKNSFNQMKSSNFF